MQKKYRKRRRCISGNFFNSSGFAPVCSRCKSVKYLLHHTCHSCSTYSRYVLQVILTLCGQKHSIKPNHTEHIKTSHSYIKLSLLWYPTIKRFIIIHEKRKIFFSTIQNPSKGEWYFCYCVGSWESHYAIYIGTFSYILYSLCIHTNQTHI